MNMLTATVDKFTEATVRWRQQRARRTCNMKKLHTIINTATNDELNITRHMKNLLLNTITTQVILACVYSVGLVHHVMCLYTPQLMLLLLFPTTPNGWPGLANLGGWFNTKLVQTWLDAFKPINLAISHLTVLRHYNWLSSPRKNWVHFDNYYGRKKTM